MDARPTLSRQVQFSGSLLVLLMLLSICMPASAETGIVFSARYYTWKHGKVKPKQKFYHLYLTRLDGTHPHLLTSGAFDDTYPKWSHDHKQIAFLRQYPSGSSYLCTFSMPGHHISRLYRVDKDEDIEFSWSSRRNLICIISTIASSSIGLPELYRFTMLDGAKVIQKRTGVQEFAWSPDNNHIFFRHSNEQCEAYNIATWKSQPTLRLANPIWLNNYCILGIRTDPDDGLGHPLSVLDIKSGQVRNYNLVVHRGEYDRDPLADCEMTWYCSPQNKSAFMLELAYHMSDGEHNWCYMATLGSSKGVANSVGGEYPFGVAFGGFSQRGTEFACYSAEWVGGYKWTGAQLGPLEIRNLSGRRIKFVTSKMVQILGASWY